MDLILTVVLFFKTICIFNFMHIHMYNIHVIESLTLLNEKWSKILYLFIFNERKNELQ